VIIHVLVVPHYGSLNNAVTMLQDRVAILIKYLEEVQKGNIPKDYDMIRKISSLCNRLPAVDSPAVDSPKFRKEYTNELNEVLLITYMSTITKGTNVLSELIEKYNVAYDRRGRKQMF
jgi:COP9 signalosome complex subunit 6